MTSHSKPCSVWTRRIIDPDVVSSKVRGISGSVFNLLPYEIFGIHLQKIHCGDEARRTKVAAQFTQAAKSQAKKSWLSYLRDF